MPPFRRKNTTSITKNFTLEELTHSDTAVHMGLRNMMPIDARYVAWKLCEEILQPLRDSIKMPIKINSGYRCPTLNRIIGSNESSQHIYSHQRGSAADIVTHRTTVRYLAQRVMDLGLPFDQMILEYTKTSTSGGWLHLSHCGAEATPRYQILAKETGLPYILINKNRNGYGLKFR